jgi:hypothetical protein
MPVWRGAIASAPTEVENTSLATAMLEVSPGVRVARALATRRI